jgi:prophage regulatory protein
MQRLLRLRDVITRVGLSRTRIYELERIGQFPSRRRISSRAVAWSEAEIEDFIQSRPRVARSVTA